MSETGVTGTVELRTALERSAGLFDLTGRTALVVGGASGLGTAIGCGLAVHGARVAVADLSLEGSERVSEEIRRAGYEACPFEVDVRESDRIDAVVDAVAEWGGSLDITFNVAGINDRKPALELEPEAFEKVLSVNLDGLYACARAAGRVMVPQGRGKVINVASTFGHVAARNQAAYAASKGGVIQLTKVLAHEWAEHGIQVNALSPGHIRTPLSRPVLDDPVTGRWVAERMLRGKAGEPWEVIGPAIFLASEASNFVTGTSLAVDGGWLAG